MISVLSVNDRISKGRLAVIKAAQGPGFGKMLLADAIKRTLAVSDQITIYSVVVDAIDDNAKGF